MHEMSLVRHLFTVLEDEVRKHGMARVRKVEIKMGTLSGAVPEFMKEAFGLYSKGTFAEGAALEIVLEPAMARCRECRSTFSAEDFVLQCPDCESIDAEFQKGRNITLERLELAG